LKTLRANSVYVDVRDLIKTVESPDGEEFSYQLNAEVMSISDEGAYENDLEIYKNEVCKVLVIDNDPNTLSQVVKSLESSKYEVRYATNVADAVQAAEEFLPHIVSLELRIPYTQKEGEHRGLTEDEFGGVDAWRQIRMSLRSSTLGVVVLTADTDKNHLVAQAAQMEIPIRNIISKREEGWHNLFLKKVSDERRRVFLGEITDARQDINEPIVEILDGSDLQNGVLKLTVNGKPFKMKVSQLAKVIGLLLTNPKTVLSFEAIKRGIGSDEPVTNSDPKNWPKRFKEIIRDQWLVTLPAANKKELAEKILESTSRGMRLNVQVIDSRLKRP
jgi:CheY-like chemotaxis protein